MIIAFSNAIILGGTWLDKFPKNVMFSTIVIKGSRCIFFAIINTENIKLGATL